MTDALREALHDGGYSSVEEVAQQLREDGYRAAADILDWHRTALQEAAPVVQPESK